MLIKDNEVVCECGGELFNNLVGDTVTSIECKDCGRQYEYEKAVDLIKIVQNSNK